MSLNPQGVHRLKPYRSSRRNPARQQRGEHKQSRADEVYQGIGWRNTIQNAPQGVARREACQQAQPEPNSEQLRGLLHDRPTHLRGRCPERQADADFTAAPRYQVTDDAVDTNDSQRQRRRRCDCQQHQQETGLPQGVREDFAHRPGFLDGDFRV